jgi:hypothetical protein
VKQALQRSGLVTATTRTFHGHALDAVTDTLTSPDDNEEHIELHTKLYVSVV